MAPNLKRTILLTFRLVFFLVIPFIFYGCSNVYVEELEDRITELESQLEEVKYKLSGIESEVDTLKFAVSDLNEVIIESRHTNWRIAASDVETAALDIENATNIIESSVSDTIGFIE